MTKYNVWKPIPMSEVPEDAKKLTSTWAMKKKSNGTYRARLNARGFEQIEGEHYDTDSTASPVASETTIRVVLTLMVMAGWHAEVLDIKGAFLHGEFEDEERVYMKISQRFEEFLEQAWY